MCPPVRLLLILFLLGSRLNAADLPRKEAVPKEVTLSWEAKLTACDAALALDPRSVRQFSTRGDTHLFLGHFAAAVADYEAMIALDPAEEAPHWRLGIAYYFTRQWEKSARQFAKYHAYDGHDRANGVWKFLADAQAHNLEAARAQMLVYQRFDREPFPALYEMLAGRLTTAQFQAHLEESKLIGNRHVMFFARYYGGLLAELQRDHESALRQVREAVALFSAAEAGEDGPGFMWQVARLHEGVLTTPAR